MADATICFIVQDERIMLIMKKRGFGVGKFNGPGGKKLANETIEEAAIRETFEETGLKPKYLEKRAILDFYFGEVNKPQWKVHVYIATQYEGVLIETDEARGEWFSIDKIPYNQMWEDDKYWLPLVLDGENIEGEFWFTSDMKKLLNYNISQFPNNY